MASEGGYHRLTQVYFVICKVSKGDQPAVRFHPLCSLSSKVTAIKIIWPFCRQPPISARQIFLLQTIIGWQGCTLLIQKYCRRGGKPCKPICSGSNPARHIRRYRRTCFGKLCCR